MSKEPMKVLTEESIDPTQQLWRAVLSQAFQDAFGPPRSDTTTTERKEAQVFLTDYEDVSFINVCENAGFDPSFIKRKVKSKFTEKFTSAIKNLSTKVRNKNEW